MEPEMTNFFVENANLDAAVDHLMQYGKFNTPPTKVDVENKIKAQLKNLYPQNYTGNPLDNCECVYQSVYCMPSFESDLGQDSYLLNLVCRLETPGITGYTKI
jgi:hypothetical protein